MVVEDTQVTCSFITKLPVDLRVSQAPLAVPAAVTRLGLSTVINHLLGLEPPKPFDFLVNGQLLRGTLEQAVLAANVSAERVLEVEYLLAVLPPSEKQELPHPDWVGAVARNPLGAGALSGSYDGVLRVWNEMGECTSGCSLHKGPITSLAVFPKAQGALVASSGKDNYLRLSALPRAGASGGEEGAGPEVLAIFRGHSGAVECSAANPSGSRIVSGSWDTTLRVWRAGSEVAAAAREAAEAGGDAGKAAGGKKRKGKGGEALAAAPLEEQGLQTLAGHTQCVAGVAWPEDNTVYSGGWDHAVRKWDVASGVNVDTLNVNRAVYCIAAAHDRPSVIAFGGVETAVRVWDARARADPTGGVTAFTSHSSWVVGVAWRPGSQHQLVSASYDKSVKLWDMRASIPLHTLTGHTEKVLSVAWLGADRLVSGGADSTVRMYDVPA